ncbi:unnamed protein product [Rodentolepis nana]|uniref:Uncharacterized protein n=1 Tax=Rodentolepis nana TaxID=102285 RepID=A0A0R3TFE1_RODNA|nr:unnamed protein product [Rodentolepis nana]
MQYSFLPCLFVVLNNASPEIRSFHHTLIVSFSAPIGSHILP